MKRNDPRIPLIALSLSVFFLTGIYYFSTSVYPYYLVGVSISLLVLLASIVYSGKYKLGLLFVTLHSTILRVQIKSIPASPIGADSDLLIQWTEIIILTGSFDSIPSTFYSNAPSFNVLAAEFGLVSSLTPTNSMLIHTIAMGALIPISGWLIARYIYNSGAAWIISSVIAGIATSGILGAYSPIPQSYATLLWLIFFISVVIFVEIPKRILPATIILFFSLAYAHKLVLLIATIFLGCSYLIMISRGVNSKVQTLTMILTMISSTIYAVQNVYITGYISAVSRALLAIIKLDQVGPPSSPSSPSHVEVVRPGLIGEYVNYPIELLFFFERSHAVFILIIAGLFWVYAILRLRYSIRLLLVLTSSALCTVFIFLGVVSFQGLNPIRVLFLSEVIYASLISAGIVKIYSHYGESNHLRLLLYSVVTVLILSQVFTVPAAPDYKNSPQYYLSDAEVSAYNHNCEYSSEIYADWYMAQTTHLHGQDCNKHQSIDRYTPDQPLFNAKIDPSRHDQISYRSRIDVYLGTYGRWELTWEPADVLNKQYNRVYDNGGVQNYS